MALAFLSNKMADNEEEPTQTTPEEHPVVEATDEVPQEDEAAVISEEPVSAKHSEHRNEENPELEADAEPDTEATTEPAAETSDEPKTEIVSESEADTEAPASEAQVEAEEEAVTEEGKSEAEAQAPAGEDQKEVLEGEKEQEVEEEAVVEEKEEEETRENAEGVDEEKEGVEEAEPTEEDKTSEKGEKEEGEAVAAEVEGVDAESKEPKEEEEEEHARTPIEQDAGATPVGEKLSRTATPAFDKEQDVAESLLPGTPQREGSEVAVEMGDEVEEEPKAEQPEKKTMYDRNALIERYYKALADRETLLNQNYQLQHKLAEHFRKKKNDDRQDYDKNVSDQEQRYLKYMDFDLELEADHLDNVPVNMQASHSNMPEVGAFYTLLWKGELYIAQIEDIDAQLEVAQLEELHHQDLILRDHYQHQIEEMRLRCEEKRDRVNEERSHFVEFKQQVAENSINSRSGKPIPAKDIEQYLMTDNKKEAEVVNVRLENIKLKNKLKKKEQQLKSKEELAEGLHLIDFEQLKIENQTYNEKIEERNEELLKLRKKITNTVQVLTHLKEKLQFVQGENQIQKSKLQEVDSRVAQKRDVLTRTKQTRDSLRIDNNRLRHNSGLLGNEPLLRDFEERREESDDLKLKLDHLKMQHAELTLNCNQVRRKIEHTKSGR